MDEEYDVVLDTLQKQIDAFWKITSKNMEMGLMNIMDDIRLEQIEELKQAMKLWRERNASI